MTSSITVYTDGACSGNPGPGGWAWAVSREYFDSGSQDHTTNQRMEVTAAAEAVATFSSQYDGIEIISDSTYVVNCFTDKWYEGWRKRNWKNSAGKPVANRDLWEPFIDQVVAHGNIHFSWVKGHSGHDMNEFVDMLAVQAIRY